jgi:phospholipase D1/2
MNEAQQLEWYESIENLVKNEAKEFYEIQQFKSFAPIRKNQTCKWYVNAEHYMEHALAGIQAAKEEIFITDWWLCPEIFLKRPSEDLQYRLDKILIKKSVKIFIKLNF